MATVGDKFVSFKSPSPTEVDRLVAAWIDEQPRDVKHMHRGIILGSKDDGYPIPERMPGQNIPVMPGQPTLYYIDIIYRDI
jgi:hypothetical protein